MLSILVGLVFIALGISGILAWFPDFLVMLRGFGPLSLLLGGIVAAIMGFASLMRRSTDEKSKK